MASTTSDIYDSNTALYLDPGLVALVHLLGKGCRERARSLSFRLAPVPVR